MLPIASEKKRYQPSSTSVFMGDAIVGMLGKAERNRTVKSSGRQHVVASSLWWIYRRGSRRRRGVSSSLALTYHLNRKVPIVDDLPINL